MTPRQRRLSGREVVRALHALGFEVMSTRGSHAKLCRTPLRGGRQLLTVPIHKELATGALPAIYRQACRFVPESSLRPHLFRDG
jgi:predicted RNA binding protein YcfA (HicA-like mRNA interferase family)